MRRGASFLAALGFLFAGACGLRAEAPAPVPAPRVTLRWEGEADLDIEIWDGAGRKYLRDAAGDSLSADAVGLDRREEFWTAPSDMRETQVVIVIGAWDFRGETEAAAEVEVAGSGETQIYRSVLTPTNNVWKVIRWDRALGRVTPVEEAGERTFGGR